jgi:hypothetical protein
VIPRGSASGPDAAAWRDPAAIVLSRISVDGLSIRVQLFPDVDRDNRRCGNLPLWMEFLQRSVIVIDAAIFLKQTDSEPHCLTVARLNVQQLVQIPMDK